MQTITAIQIIKKLKNLAEGTGYRDAITKHQLNDSAIIDKQDNNKDVYLQGNNNVI